MNIRRSMLFLILLVIVGCGSGYNEVITVEDEIFMSGEGELKFYIVFNKTVEIVWPLKRPIIRLRIEHWNDEKKNWECAWAIEGDNGLMIWSPVIYSVLSDNMRTYLRREGDIVVGCKNLEVENFIPGDQYKIIITRDTLMNLGMTSSDPNRMTLETSTLYFTR